LENSHATSGSQDHFDGVDGDREEMREGFFSDEVALAAFEAASLRPDTLAVDVGAGSGLLTRRLSGLGLRVIAVDRSDAIIRELQDLLPGEGAPEVRNGEADNFPIRPSTSDCVFTNIGLHHVEDPEDALREMVRALKPGRRLVINSP
jgi:ubiquinone/menaquinone biosynthesis C-methylase UbiE